MLWFRMYRFILSIIKIIFFKLTNKKLKMCFGKNRVEKGFNIICNNGDIEIGDGFYGGKYGEIESIDGKITIGNRVFFNDRIKIVGMGKIKILDDCIFGPGVQIYDHNHKFKDIKRTISKQGFSIGEIFIEEDVWIGANTIITEGVKIGRHSVIGANSVVTKDIPEYSVAVGSPAKVIKKIYE